MRYRANAFQCCAHPHRFSYPSTGIALLHQVQHWFVYQFWDHKEAFRISCKSTMHTFAVGRDAMVQGWKFVSQLRARSDDMPMRQSLLSKCSQREAKIVPRKINKAFFNWFQSTNSDNSPCRSIAKFSFIEPVLELFIQLGTWKLSIKRIRVDFSNFYLIWIEFRVKSIIVILKCCSVWNFIVGIFANLLVWVLASYFAHLSCSQI